MTTDITIAEAAYIDPRAGNDKFYRTYVLGSSWVTQYGRNGTIGTFTKLIETASPGAAQKAATAKFASKVKKGYDPVRSGTVTSTTDITAENLVLLDELAQLLPAGVAATVIAQPVNAVDLGAQRADDLTDAVATALWNSFSTGSVVLQSDLAPDLPVRPMLASVAETYIIDQSMTDPRWVAQYKYDGDRVIVEVTHGEIRVLNRQGEQKTKNVGTAQLHPFSALHAGRWVFDGEVVGRTLVLFDLIAASDAKTTWIRGSEGFTERYRALSLITAVLGIPPVDTASNTAPVVLAPVATSIDDKAQFLANAHADQREGIILRHTGAEYQFGRRSMDLLKHKLIKDADVIVTALHETKQSATLSVYNRAGTLIEVGQASTIGKGDVEISDVWVVTFLYVTNPEHPRLFQPRLVNKRSDKVAAECLFDQFADAGTNKVV